MPVHTTRANVPQRVLELHLHWNRILLQIAVRHCCMQENANHTNPHATTVDLVGRNKEQFGKDYFPLFLPKRYRPESPTYLPSLS